jgi:hypothetical protein
MKAISRIEFKKALCRFATITLCFAIIGCGSTSSPQQLAADPPTPSSAPPPSGDATAPSFVAETDGSCATSLFAAACGKGTSAVLPPVAVSAVAGHALLVIVWFNDTPGSVVSSVSNGADTFKSLGSIADGTDFSSGVGVFLAQNIVGGASNINVTVQRLSTASPAGISASMVMVREYAGVLHGLDKTTTAYSNTISDMGTTFGAQIVPSLQNELVLAVCTADFPLMAGNGAINFSSGPTGTFGGLFVEETPAPTATTMSPQFFIASLPSPPPGAYHELLVSIY